MQFINNVLDTIDLFALKFKITCGIAKINKGPKKRPWGNCLLVIDFYNWQREETLCFSAHLKFILILHVQLYLNAICMPILVMEISIFRKTCIVG